MGDLARYTAPSAAVASPATDASRYGVAATTENAQWTGRVLGWGDVPGGDAGIPRPALVEGVIAQVGAKKATAGLVQVRHAYRAHAHGVHLLTLHRPLTRRADGRLSPAGEWAVTAREDLRGTPRVTRGVVEVVYAQGTVTEEGPSVTVPLAHREAARVAGYLPGVVVDGVERAVPTPRLYLAELVRTDDDSVTQTQTLSLLRLGDATAVALRAEREGSGDLALAPWTVTQYRYDLTPSRMQIGGTR